MRIQTKIIYVLFAILPGIYSNTIAQQPDLPDQVKKGKWAISHDIFSIAYYNERLRSYDGNNNPVGSEKTGRLYSSLSLVSPSWGSLGLVSGKTRRYAINGAELEDVKSNSWVVGLTPSIGYFIQERLLLGALAQVYFSRDRTTYATPNGSQEYDYKYTTIGIGPEIRYYFGKLNTKRLFHAGLATNIVYRINRQKAITRFINGPTSESNNAVRQPDFRIQPYLGSSWFAGRHWTFTGSLFFSAASSNYKLRVMDSNGSSRSGTKNTRTDIGIRAGVNYTF